MGVALAKVQTGLVQVQNGKTRSFGSKIPALRLLIIYNLPNSRIWSTELVDMVTG